jgi:transposase InsO family protein
MDQRTQFIADWLRDSLSFTELCELYGVSRKTGYKWTARYREGGAAALEERSSAPQSCPHKTSERIITAILQARRHHPSWGPKKLLKLVQQQHLGWTLPARSTVADILSRHGLTARKTNRRKPGHPGKPSTVAETPNDLWTVDFKGQFKTLDGYYCYPLTVVDAHSRFLLACRALYSTACAEAKPVFQELFKDFGMPKRIRSDNGVPFATVSLARLSSLSAWWVRLGILPELIEPGCPQQNGAHERMHRTLKAETTRPPAYSRRTQQRKFNAFLHEFNHLRPHEALEMETPASKYTTSLRRYPGKPPPLTYPEHFETRYVSANGSMRWNSRFVTVSSTCIGEYVGLEEIDHGIWNVYFGPLKLGRLLEDKMRIEDEFGRLRRRRQ